MTNKTKGVKEIKAVKAWGIVYKLKESKDFYEIGCAFEDRGDALRKISNKGDWILAKIIPVLIIPIKKK